MRLSARNQIPATVTGITFGEATANIELDAGGVRLVASITVEATRELGLAEGARVTAVIKASDVIVGVELSPGYGSVLRSRAFRSLIVTTTYRAPGYGPVPARSDIRLAATG